MTNFFLEKVSSLKKQHLYKFPKKNKPNLTSFCSNDYLGLSKNKDVINASIEASKKYGFGSTSSRYIYTNNDLSSELEEAISNYKNSDKAIIFGSGNLAGISTISAILDKNDLIIADKLIHSCLIEGARLSEAKLLRFAHNNLDHAKKILDSHRKNYKKCLIISETVFSMDGDLGKIEELLKLALDFNCLMLSDDAHGLGIIKNNYDKKYDDLHLQMGTFSKAAGGYGGYVCGSNILIDYLKNFARSAIYSTSLPSSIIAGNLKSLEIIKNDTSLSLKALSNANYFCKLLNLPKTESCIVVIITKNTDKAMDIAKKVEEYGYIISAIRPPTVPVNGSRLRITFSCKNKKSDISKLAKYLRLLLN